MPLTCRPGDILILGAIAGSTIFLGLPIARLRNPSTGLKAFLTSIATGILLFLFWDVLSNGVEPVEERAPRELVRRTSPSYSALLLGGFGLGLHGARRLRALDARHRRRSLLGPGAASAAEFETP